MFLPREEPVALSCVSGQSWRRQCGDHVGPIPSAIGRKLGVAGRINLSQASEAGTAPPMVQRCSRGRRTTSMVPVRIRPLPMRARVHKPGPVPVNANRDPETGVGVLAARSDAATGFRVGEATNESAGEVCPLLGLCPPLAVTGGLVVVEVVGVTPPQLVKVPSLPENHLPLRRTSAWKMHEGVAGTATVNVPDVPDVEPTRVPLAHRFRVQVVPGPLLLPMTKVAVVEVSEGARPPANAKLPHPSIPTATAPTHDSSRFIALLLARRSYD
jgi:hypothetical protein